MPRVPGAAGRAQPGPLLKTVGEAHPVEAGEAADALELGLEPMQAAAARAHAGLEPERRDVERALARRGLHVEPADQALALEQRKDVVAPPPLGRRHEDLDAVVEAEQPGEAVAVAQQRIERVERAQTGGRRRQVPDQRPDVRAGEQLALAAIRPFDQGRQRRLAEVGAGPGAGLRGRQQAPEARDLAGRGAAQALERAPAGPVDERLMAGLGLAQRRRDHALGQVVDLLEALAAG